MLTSEEVEVVRLGEKAAAMGRGDINSQEKGSGARADTGKPNWGLMPLNQIVIMHNCALIDEGPCPEDPMMLDDLLQTLAAFQSIGAPNLVKDLLNQSMVYLMDNMNAEFTDACEEVIRVWEHGEEKYAAFNWMKGMSWNSIIACYMRHWVKLNKGTEIDEESGRHHGAHLVCNAMMLCHYVEYYPQGNDLPTRWFSKETNDGRQDTV